MPSTATTFWDHSLQIDLNLMKQMEKINKAIKQHLMSASRLNLVLLQHLNRENLFDAFDPSALSVANLSLWMQGTKCDRPSGTSTSPTLALHPPPSSTTPSSPTSSVVLIYCPMPFQPSTYNECCFQSDKLRCCVSSSEPSGSGGNASMKWIVGISVVFFCCILAIVVIATFNKCTRLLWKSAPDAKHRPKIHLNKRRHEILPVDKRVILKTGNYTVEQSWDVITIKFYSRDFYDHFKDSLIGHYPVLSCWRDARKRQEAQVTDFSGLEVTLLVNDDMRSLLVTDDGALSWVMGDFQTVCKNIKLSGIPEIAHMQAPSRPLSPRQPTIGEEFYDAGDYNVKVSQTQIEIKFVSETLFDSFKRVLLGRYPSLPWSKYLQRDCAQIQMESGRTVTVHMWEDIRSIWLSGDGKKDWYGKEFQEIYSNSQLQSHSSANSIPNSSQGPANKVTFTVKTLYMGGYEIEFPLSDFLPKMKILLQEKYPTANWYVSSCRDEVNLPVAKVKSKTQSILVQLGNAKVRERKMWINGEAEVLKQWMEELNQMYVTAAESVNKKPSPD